ncbi:hypothetical protein [Pectinatus haikarae]|uniref:Uncharacterized protein n=1 Tax=Pectinatus haikarae TaxID=349096 RepID=A0ABT9Y5P1_9FIRM|nr:hypothetical protein [Pectinatus haikarae]MDQ0202454.1 hypothetical protein [Pectinatus haikarae]
MDETNLYLEFIKKNFPESAIAKNINIYDFYKIIQEVNLSISILSKYAIQNDNDCWEIFLSRFQDALNKLLLYLPLNDSTGINILFRIMVESLLKYLYSISIDSDFNKIDKLAYRELKAKLKHTNIDYQVLYSIYAKYSNSIHVKKEYNNDTIIILQDIISSKQPNIVKLINEVLKLVNIYNERTIKLSNIKITTFSMAEVKSLKRYCSPSYLKNYFYKYMLS